MTHGRTYFAFHMLKLFQLRHVAGEGLFEHSLRFRAGQVDLREAIGLVDEFDRFGNQMLVKMLENLFVEPRRNVEPERVPAFGEDVVDERLGQSFRPRVAEIGFAAAAERKVLDVVRAEVVQERRRVFPETRSLPAGERSKIAAPLNAWRYSLSGFPKLVGTALPAPSVKVAPTARKRFVSAVGSDIALNSLQVCISYFAFSTLHYFDRAKRSRLQNRKCKIRNADL